jgi:hypothetical protein
MFINRQNLYIPRITDLEWESINGKAILVYLAFSFYSSCCRPASNYIIHHDVQPLQNEDYTADSHNSCRTADRIFWVLRSYKLGKLDE